MAWSAELEPEAEAADAAVTRLRKRKAEAEQAGEVVDAERDTLAYLAELRAALAGEVTSNENVEAVRAALLRVFEQFTLHRADQFDLDSLAEDDTFTDAAAAGEYVIVVEPRAEAVRGLDDLWAPVLRRESLGLIPDSRSVSPWSNGQTDVFLCNRLWNYRRGIDYGKEFVKPSRLQHAHYMTLATGNDEVKAVSFSSCA